jgi:hypothetical protein
MRCGVNAQPMVSDSFDGAALRLKPVPEGTMFAERRDEPWALTVDSAKRASVTGGRRSGRAEATTSRIVALTLKVQGVAPAATSRRRRGAMVWWFSPKLRH